MRDPEDPMAKAPAHTWTFRARARIKGLVSRETFGERFVNHILGRYLELS